MSSVSMRVMAWLIAAAVIAGGAGAWWLWRGSERTSAAFRQSAITSWKGGESSACVVTVNGASLAEFSREYNVAMVCGVGGGDRDRLTDRAVTISDATAIQPTELVIEEAVSGPMRVLLEQLAIQDRSASPPDANTLHEETLWYELLLLPKGIDTLDLATMGDAERAGGRRLSQEPLWTVITVRP